MRLLKAGDHKRMEWKNGRGETIEIAVHPATADLGGFDWRVSMATVAGDGPFSIFPGVDRTLCILDGEGMELEVDGLERRRLTRESPPCRFSADAPTEARLLKGPVTDLNVMTRRGRWRHEVRRATIEGHAVLDLGAAAAMVLCCRGSIRLDLGSSSFRLHRHDALFLEEPVPEVAAFADTASIFYLILFDKAGAAQA